MSFKLPPIYTERVLALATPPLHENYKISELITRNRTPLYLSNQVEVKHVNIATMIPNPTPILILCSDRLCDLYKRQSPISSLPQDVQLWLTTTSPIECRSNLASELLWDALDGDGGIQAATKTVRGMPGRRIDDNTVVVIQLSKSYRISPFPSTDTIPALSVATSDSACLYVLVSRTGPYFRGESKGI